MCGASLVVGNRVAAGAAHEPIAALTIPEMIDMMIEPSTAHQNPSIVTPTSNRLSESHDAS